MKISTLLISPWRVTHRSQSWLMLAIFALCIAVAMAIGQLSGSPHWWFGSAALYCIGIVFFWTLQAPHLLLVSMDARRLGIPGIPRAAARSVSLYAVLCVAAPVLVLVPFGADPVAVTLVAALTITSGLAFALLPRYAWMLVWALFFVGQVAARRLHIPLPNHPSHTALAAWGICALVVLLVVDIWRWRTLARGGSSLRTGIRSPLVMQFGQDNSLRLSGRPAQHEQWLIRQIPEWLQGRVDLRDADQAHPWQAIRVALGRSVMPLTLQSHVRKWAIAAAWLVFALIVLLGDGSSHEPHALLQSNWFWMLIGGFVMVAIPSNRLTAVQRRWSGTNAELPLLALLPGLGNPSEQKRHTLHAILLQPGFWWLGALLACWLVVTALGASVFIGLYALLAIFGSGALLGATVFGSLGGKPLGGITVGALFVTLLVLVGLTPGIDRLPSMFFFESSSTIVAMREVFILGWLAWLTAVGALAARGWRLLQRRPHPFLANDP